MSEDKKVIKLKFSDGVVISVINHDEKADVSCVVIDYGENTEYMESFKVTAEDEMDEAMEGSEFEEIAGMTAAYEEADFHSVVAEEDLDYNM